MSVLDILELEIRIPNVETSHLHLVSFGGSSAIYGPEKNQSPLGQQESVLNYLKSLSAGPGLHLFTK